MRRIAFLNFSDKNVLITSICAPLKAPCYAKLRRVSILPISSGEISKVLILLFFLFFCWLHFQKVCKC